MDYDEAQFGIEALITLLPAEQGGRKTPARSGYRPQFYYDGHDWDARQDYGDVAEVLPGESVTARLTFLSPQCHIGKIQPDMEFLLREGQRVVGQGTVTRILNLEANAERARRDSGDCGAPWPDMQYEWRNPRPKYKRKKRTT